VCVFVCVYVCVCVREIEFNIFTHDVVIVFRDLYIKNKNSVMFQINETKRILFIFTDSPLALSLSICLFVSLCLSISLSHFLKVCFRPLDKEHFHQKSGDS